MPKTTIRRTFLAMLIAFVVPQIVLFINLSSKFQEIARQSQQFKVKRGIFVRTEELIYELVIFRNAAWRASQEHDFQTAGRSLARYKTLMNETKKLYQDTTGDEFVHCELRTVLIEEKQFIKAITQIREAAFSLHEDSHSFLNLSNQTVERLLDLLHYESANAATAYTLSNALQGQILTTVLFAGVFDPVALILLSIVGLRITNKISTLKQKAEDFANGTELTTTITGTDELAFLDRTPLASILAILETIKAGVYGTLSADDLAVVAAAEKDALKLLNRINNLLTLEKIEAGAVTLHCQNFSVRECLTRVAAKYSPPAVEAGVRLQLDVEADRIIQGDQSLFETMLAELINNAVDAAPPASVIDLSLKQEHGLQILVENSGSKIDDRLSPHIFERFRFVDGTPLIGVGLPLAQRIAKMHGAELSICSRSNSSNVAIVAFTDAIRTTMVST